MHHRNHTLTSHAQNLAQIDPSWNFPKVFYFYACIILHMNNTVTKILLPECSIRVLTTQALIYNFQYILNVILECIEPFNTIKLVY